MGKVTVYSYKTIVVNWYFAPYNTFYNNVWCVYLHPTCYTYMYNYAINKCINVHEINDNNFVSTHTVRT